MQKLLFSYLKFWATGYLKRTNPEIIAITGSVGKTSAKEAIFDVLKIKFGDNVRRSSGNLNNETGVPLAVLNFKSSPKNSFSWIPVLISVPFRSLFLKSAKILVLEIAADKPGDIKYLTSFIKPKVAVLTAIGPTHLAAYESIEQIIEEKTDLLRALDSEGFAVLNLDNDLVRKVSYGGRWKKVTYGIDNLGDISASDIKTEIKDYEGNASFKLKMKDGAKEVTQKTLGLKVNILASLAGAAVGQIYDMKLEEIANELKNVISEKHRMNVFKGKNGTTIIDDSYNANPLSMRAALDLLRHLIGKRKIAVLGDMRELGAISNEAHTLIGEYAHQVADVVVAVGEEAVKFKSDHYFKSREKATEYILKEMREGDIILIKASRGIGLDKIAEELKS